MRFFALSALALVASARMTVTEQLKDDRVLRMLHDGKPMLAEDEEKLKDILSEADVWGSQQDGSVDVRMTPAIASLMPKFGFNVTDVTDKVTEELEWVHDPANGQICNDKACTEGDDFYTRYQRRAPIETRFDSIIAGSSIAEKISIGASVGGLDVFGLKLSTGSSKPIVLYFCGTHAREWLPPMFCTFMAEELASQYAAGQPRVTAALDAFDFVIVPLLNPDGYEYSHTTANMWRKNREVNSGSTCIGTDLNRNYASHWAQGGSSSNPCSDTYHGASPLSAPETANLDRWASQQSANIAVQVDVHAYGQMWMHPWGWTRDLSPDDAEMLRCGDATANAIRQVSGLNFATGSIARVIYVASGSSCDHFYELHGTTYAYAPEVRGSSFQPPASNIGPSNAELWEGMLAGVECAM